MGQADWAYIGAPNKTERSNVMITITDNAAVAEGETVTAFCNNKTFTSTIRNGIAKLYTSEVGTYTITAGEYSTMLVCPYFGMFSTDIYSGVLKVTCIEEGGNNKTCHVQSCDDEYNLINNYNLTQTFDAGLELVFLGIPTGKYLITVEDKYRFYKEITSIQNISTINVELKQWLFNNGEQCEWNTGGWMQCQCDGSITTTGHWSNGFIYTSTATHDEEFQLTSDSIRLYQHCTAVETSRFISGSVFWYARSNVVSRLYIGTKKKLPFSLERYNSLNYNSNKSITIALRSGSLNNTNTNTTTPTVLVQGSNYNLEISLLSESGSAVIGNIFTCAGYGRTADGGELNGGTTRNSKGNLNETFIADITEIYLV